MSDQIITSLNDGIQHIQMNRGEKKNALTNAMYIAMTDALQESDKNADIFVNLLYGVPGCFTAGNDIEDFMTLVENGELSASIVSFLTTLATLEKPLILAIEGPAVGIGTTMTFHADLIYATETATFSTPFANLGITPEAGSSYLMPSALGHARAYEMLALSNQYTAKQAKAAGIINDIIAPAQLIEQCHNTALKLAAKPQSAIKNTKQLMRAPFKEQILKTIKQEVEIFKTQLKTEDAKAAFQAFLSK